MPGSDTMALITENMGLLKKIKAERVIHKEIKMSDNDVKSYGWSNNMSISLHDKLKQDLKTALLGRDASAKDCIRMIMSEYPKLTVPLTLESGKKTTRLKKSEEITDDDILNIIRKLVKSEKSVLEFKKENSSGYLEMLERYLPQMASEQEIEIWISKNIDLAGYKNPMQAMGPVMKHFGKLADGNLVKLILQNKG